MWDLNRQKCTIRTSFNINEFDDAHIVICESKKFSQLSWSRDAASLSSETYTTQSIATCWMIVLHLLMVSEPFTSRDVTRPEIKDKEEDVVGEISLIFEFRDTLGESHYYPPSHPFIDPSIHPLSMCTSSSSNPFIWPSIYLSIHQMAIHL